MCPSKYFSKAASFHAGFSRYLGTELARLVELRVPVSYTGAQHSFVHDLDTVL
jgi:hypothetical protein